jgi:hypothetical protein
VELVAKEMEAQLRRWRLEIARRASKTQKPGARHEDLMHIDELKAYHAVARSRYQEWAHLAVELKIAWGEMEEALRKPME